MPETKESWLRKTLYGVFVKKTQRLKRIVKRVVKKMVKKLKTNKVSAEAVTDDDHDHDSLFGDGEEAQDAAEDAAEEADDEVEEEVEEEVEVEEEEWYDGNVDFYQADDYAVYGSLDQANQEAIKEWVRLTMKPSSANLDELACRQQAARQELQRRLADKGEGEFFSETMEDGEKTVEVFTKKSKMKGARN